MKLILTLCLLLSSFLVLADQKYSLNGFTKETRLEFQELLKDDYLVNKDITRLSYSANLKLKKLLNSNLKEARELSKLNLNLISWPTEDKLIYKYGEIILKDKN
jgi:hypothetical protein